MTFSETDVRRDDDGRFSEKTGGTPEVSLRYEGDASLKTDAPISRARAAALAEDMLDHYGLTAEGWTFAFDRATTREGQCHYAKKVISYSGPVLEHRSREEFRQTMLHEIAHALTPGAQHGPRWKAMAKRLGYEGKTTVEATAAIRQVQRENGMKRQVGYATDGTPVYSGDKFANGMKRYTVGNIRRSTAILTDQDGEESLGDLNAIADLIKAERPREADPTKVARKNYPRHGLYVVYGDIFVHRQYGRLSIHEPGTTKIIMRASNGKLYRMSVESVARMARQP
jgi:hypothetical protein